MKFSACLFFLLLFISQSHAQAPVIDSLKQLLITAANDTSKIRLLNQLAEVAEDTTSLNYGRRALQLLQSLPVSFQNKNRKFFLYQQASSFYWISSYFNRYTDESDSGIIYLQRTLQVALDIKDSLHVGLVYNDLAVLNRFKGADSSLYWLHKSIPFTIASKDSSQLATAYNNFGYLYRIKGEYQKALDYLFMGMKIDEKLGNETSVAVELNNIGQIYLEMEFYNEALEYCRRSLRIFQKAKDEQAIALRFNNLGGIYDRLYKYDSALMYYDSSLQIRTRVGSKSALAKSYSNLGTTWVNLKDYDKAIFYYHQSVWNAKHSKDTAQLYDTYSNLAAAFLRKGVKTDSAEVLLKSAYDYFKVKGSPRNMMLITNLLIDVYGKKNDFEKAYAFTLEYLTARDSVESKDARKSALRKQFEFEYQNKAALAAASQQKKDDLAEEKLTQQKNFRNFAIAGMVLLLIIIALLFNRFRLKQKTAKELEAKNKIIEKEKQRAEESEKFKSRFLANMSHEIRTPMNAVIGLTNLLLDSSATEKQKFYLGAIKKSSENLMVILNDVLDLSKLEAGKMQLEKTLFRIQDVIENVVVTLRHKADEKGLKLETNIANDIPEFVKGDSTKLYQVLINLVGNAIKFTETGNVVIEVTLELSDIKIESSASHFSLLSFHITDTGIGIPKEKLKTIFESFRQAANDTSRKFGGTGLGLSISQQIIQLHGSEIQVTSEENKGSVFSFTIQYEISRAEEFRNFHQPATEIDYSRFASLKILLAEDNEYNQLVTVESLKRLVPTLRIDVTENGREALDALLEEDYDLILMDVQMPEMNGYEATKTIRQEFSGKKKLIPIIALTASATREEIETGFQSGISAHLPKPFIARDLLLAIAHALGWSSGNENSNALFAETFSNEADTIDFSALKKYSEGDSKLMKLYIEKFIESAPQTFSKIKIAFESNAFDEVKRMIHSMKPQLVLLGLHKLNHLATEIEDSVSSALPKEKIYFHFSKFESALNKAITVLSNSSLS
ncbi:MAG: response regulator [Chitinophagales bacterium]|nr:response regulator [Chitinophagales bacterium]